MTFFYAQSLDSSFDAAAGVKDTVMRTNADLWKFAKKMNGVQFAFIFSKHELVVHVHVPDLRYERPFTGRSLT